jgi:predicted transcriptional regulator YdeE
MTEEQWTHFENRLSYPLGKICLEIDGYKVTYLVVQTKKLKYAIMTYINGEYQWEWTTNAENPIREKFLRKTFKYIYKKEYRSRGKEHKAYLKKAGIDVDGKIDIYTPLWTSAKALRRHLIKNNKSIELLED